MIKQTMPKPIVFDKDTYIKNLHNWVHVDDDWRGLDYDGDGTMYYEFSVDYMVGDDEVSVWVEVTHVWEEYNDFGDYWTPPSCDIHSEHTETYVTQVCINAIEVELGNDLTNRLEYLINDTIVED
jgi:hypothetical protein